MTGYLTTSMSSVNVIEITAINLSLDLNGWKVDGQAAGTGTLAVGIFNTASIIIIKNGSVRGFFSGVVLLVRGLKVTGFLIDQNTHEGILVGGPGAHVKNNNVVDTGGSTTAVDMNARGIFLVGSDSLAESNIVSGLTAVGDGFELEKMLLDLTAKILDYVAMQSVM